MTQPFASDSLVRGRRPQCPSCRRPQQYCLCPHVHTLRSRTRFLVLQHPAEARHPLNTGRLLALGLVSAQLWVGENFPDLPALIAREKTVCLLFPGEGAQVPQALLPSDSAPLLIVPDGTWRKARKIIHANPVLQSLPRWQLPSGASSRYRIRQARQPGAVATIEAVQRILGLLEPKQDFSALLKPFDVLIEQQIQAMGDTIYRQHYGDTGG